MYQYTPITNCPVFTQLRGVISKTRAGSFLVIQIKLNLCWYIIPFQPQFSKIPKDE